MCNILTSKYYIHLCFELRNLLQMEIIGQFNLGFIITRLEDDLFIIDQHATDEKFRFEKLSNEMRLKTQKLIIPKLLNFSALNENILIEHQQTFEDNGFTFNINEQGIYSIFKIFHNCYHFIINDIID